MRGLGLREIRNGPSQSPHSATLLCNFPPVIGTNLQPPTLQDLIP
uniref:Uncharacterized protein n=1 Tax=Molossus molossus TaxID=27622 RepID=A0A7J8E2Q8_MOLMO|nr:hypothetical protein HJG59_009011 [Molossus molossus]